MAVPPADLRSAPVQHPAPVARPPIAWSLWRSRTSRPITRARTLKKFTDRTRQLRAFAFSVAATLCATAAIAQTSEPAESPAATAGATEIRVQLVPLHSATLSSEMAGRIESIATRVGDRFAALRAQGPVQRQPVIPGNERPADYYSVDSRFSGSEKRRGLALCPEYAVVW